MRPCLTLRPSPAIALVLGLLLAGASPARTSEAAPAAVECGWHHGVDLAAAVARLAGYEEYAGPGWAAWIERADRHFGPHRSHPAVANMQRLRQERGIAYDAVILLGLLLSDDGSGARWSGEHLPSGFDERWTAPEATAAVQSLLAFARDADYPSFRADTADLRDEVLAGFCDFVARHALDLERYAAWFDLPLQRHRFMAVPGAFNGGSNYGPSVDYGDVRVNYAIIGLPSRTSDGHFHWRGRTDDLLAHEFAHSFVNPWVDRHAQMLEDDAARTLFGHARDTLMRHKYPTPRIMLYETVVRAASQVVIAARQGPIPALSLAHSDAQMGFPWSQSLAESMRATAPGTGLAAERVSAVIREWSSAPQRVARGIEAEALLAQYWEQYAGDFALLALDPPDAGCGVDAGARELTLRVNRRADPGHLALMHSAELGGEYPPGRAPWSWHDDGTLLRLPVTLAPDTDYALWIGRGTQAGILSEDGHGLRSQAWRFSTRACDPAPAR